MLKSIQDIINSIALNMIANSTAYVQYRDVGRDTTEVVNNLLLLYNLYWSVPYFSQVTPQSDIERAQYIINLTTLL